MPAKPHTHESQEGEDILSTIGETPLLLLPRLAKWAGLPEGTAIAAKAEHLNPGGSGKDRIALALLEGAEAQGLQPGGAVVEATSGNTGIALAQACAVKGYQLHVVASEKVSREKISLLEALGATVHRTPLVPHNHPDHYLTTARRLAQQLDAVHLQQFENPANTQVHRHHTGPEILKQLYQLGRHPDAFVAGVGTGGTLSGVAQTLKRTHPDCRIVLADPEGSILAAGGQASNYLTEGIGDDHHPPLYEAELVDTAVTVPDETAFHFALAAARLEGLLIGGSAGAHLAAACTLARTLPPQSTVVTVLPDTGRNYLSTFFDPEWCREKGIEPPNLETPWDPQTTRHTCRIIQEVTQ